MLENLLRDNQIKPFFHERAFADVVLWKFNSLIAMEIVTPLEASATDFQGIYVGAIQGPNKPFDFAVHNHAAPLHVGLALEPIPESLLSVGGNYCSQGCAQASGLQE